MTAPKVQTAFAIILREDNRLDVLTEIGGIDAERPASSDDMYRLVCQLKADLEASRSAMETVRVQQTLARQAMQQQTQANLIQGVKR